jgi:hypothetical protein
MFFLIVTDFKISMVSDLQTNIFNIIVFAVMVDFAVVRSDL